MKEYCKQQEEDRLCREVNHRRWEEKLLAKEYEQVENDKYNYSIQPVPTDINNTDSEKSCFDCEINLAWACKDGWAHCGCRPELGSHGRINPKYAKQCPRFVRKKQ